MLNDKQLKIQLDAIEGDAIDHLLALCDAEGSETLPELTAKKLLRALNRQTSARVNPSLGIIFKELRALSTRIAALEEEGGILTPNDEVELPICPYCGNKEETPHFNMVSSFDVGEEVLTCKKCEQQYRCEQLQVVRYTTHRIKKP
jgi:hypothetical protein